MSQNAIVLPETGEYTGLAIVEKVNDALDTLATNFAGPTGYVNPFPYMIQRNTTNNTWWWWDPVAAEWTALSVGGNTVAVPRGYLDGFMLSNNGSDANNDIDIAAGYAMSDNALGELALTSAMTKQLDAAWAEGTNAGGLDTGTKAVSTWYYPHIIRRDSDYSFDALESLSVTAPTMPSGFTARRRVGALRTDGSGNIRGGIWRGDRFLFHTPILDVNASAVATGWADYTLTVPPIAGVRALVLITFQDATVNTYLNCRQTGTSGAGFALLYCQVANAYATILAELMTNGSSQVGLNPSATADLIQVNTLGWIDPRGRDL